MPQHGPISHPQKIPGKHRVLKVCGRNSKECNYPRSRKQVADQIISLQPSDYSLPPQRKGVLQGSAKEPWDPQIRTCNRPTRAGYPSRQADCAVTGSPIPDVNPSGPDWKVAAACHLVYDLNHLHSWLLRTGINSGCSTRVRYASYSTFDFQTAVRFRVFIGLKLCIKLVKNIAKLLIVIVLVLLCNNCHWLV